MSPAEHCDLNLFSTRQTCSREQRKKQHDWLATNTDDIRFLLLRAKKNRQVENGLKASFPLIAKPTRKLAVRTCIQSEYLKALAVSLRVGFCDEWKRGFSQALNFNSNFKKRGLARYLSPRKKAKPS